MSALQAVTSPTRAAAPAAELVARGLSHRYGRRVGLEPVSFTCAAPGVVAVTGPNGSGKSTLLRILAGLLRPTGGASTLTIAGRDIGRTELRRHLGFLSPALAFYEELSITENLRFAAEAMDLEAPGAAVAAAIGRVELAERADDRVGALSSGLEQRLRIAFALLRHPSVLLMDEPGSHLDEEGHAWLLALVREEASRSLIVLATNDPREWTLAEQRIELRGRGLGRPA